MELRFGLDFTTTFFFTGDNPSTVSLDVDELVALIWLDCRWPFDNFEHIPKSDLTPALWLPSKPRDTWNNTAWMCGFGAQNTFPYAIYEG